MGEGAVQLILDALSGSAAQEKVVDLGFQIIQRRSTRGH
ncbi:hypothetical protein, partial [Thioclava sp.]